MGDVALGDPLPEMHHYHQQHHHTPHHHQDAALGGSASDESQLLDADQQIPLPSSNAMGKVPTGDATPILARSASDESIIVSQLVDADQRIKFAAIANLTQRVNDAYGIDAIELAEGLRVHGGIECLTHLLEDPEADVQQCAMSVLGNLLTDVFEQHAIESLHIFSSHGGLSLLVAQLCREYPHSLYAAACMQNVTALDPHRTCEALNSLGANATLENIVLSGEDANVDQQASHRPSRTQRPDRTPASMVSLALYPTHRIQFLPTLC